MTNLKGDEKAQEYYRLLVSHYQNLPALWFISHISVVSLQMQFPWEGQCETLTTGLNRNTEH